MKKLLFILTIFFYYHLSAQFHVINLTEDYFEFNFNNDRIEIMQKNSDKDLVDFNESLLLYESTFKFRDGSRWPVYIAFRFENDSLTAPVIQFAVNLDQEKYTYLYNELDYLLGDFSLQYSHQYAKDTILQEDAFELIKSDEYWGQRYHNFNSIVYSVSCEKTKQNTVSVSIILYRKHDSSNDEKRIVIFDIAEELEILWFSQFFDI